MPARPGRRAVRRSRHGAPGLSPRRLERDDALPEVATARGCYVRAVPMPQLAFALAAAAPASAEQAAGPRRRARHRVRRDGRHERVVRADDEAVPRRARRSARGVGRSPRSRAPRRVRGRSAVRARRPRPSTARAPRWSRPSSCARPDRSTRSCTHVDLDGLYAAAKWILGGEEPYRRRRRRRARGRHAGRHAGPDRDADRSRAAREVPRRSAQARGRAVPRRRHEARRRTTT